MAFLIRAISRTNDGREIVRETPAAGTRLSIGRASTNDIALPDLAVEQQHAVIEQDRAGDLRIAATGSLGFAINGQPSTSARIDLREGAEIAIGSYRLTIAMGDTGDVVVTVDRPEDREASHSDVVGGFSLAHVMPGRRAIAWSTLIAILLAFLAVPIFTHLTRAPAELSVEGKGQVVMDASWSPGALSLAHHGLEDTCEACHVNAFEAVRDNACVACHEDSGSHAPASRLASARQPFGTGEALLWQVAHTFGKPGPGACRDCHIEHVGSTRMEPPRQQFCADCHNALDRRLSDTTLASAADFGSHHPEFSARLAVAPGRKETRRISLADTPREAHGLRFPHKLHLDPKGGPARMAWRIGAKRDYGEGLVCKDCHRVAPDKVSFVPIEMERDCESCHSLVYDVVGSTYRTLRHGDVEQMLADLRAMDRGPRRPIVSGRKRPGEFAGGGLYHVEFAAPSSSLIAIDRAFQRTGVCGECHLPATTGGRPGVIPVSLPTRYFVNGWFDHDAHRQEDCTSCHAAKGSESSADLLLPDLKSCRTCHMGESDRKAEVPSGCAMCHSYHPAVGETSLRPRKRTAQAASLTALAPVCVPAGSTGDRSC